MQIECTVHNLAQMMMMMMIMMMMMMMINEFTLTWLKS